MKKQKLVLDGDVSEPDYKGSHIGNDHRNSGVRQFIGHELSTNRFKNDLKHQN